MLDKWCRKGVGQMERKRCWTKLFGKVVGENRVEKVLDKLREKGVGQIQVDLLLVKME
jgi:hypothetical protein